MSLRSCAPLLPRSVTRTTEGQVVWSVLHRPAQRVPVHDPDCPRGERDPPLALELLEAHVDPLATRPDGRAQMGLGDSDTARRTPSVRYEESRDALVDVEEDQ